jgi:hypothetical protein
VDSLDPCLAFCPLGSNPKQLNEAKNSDGEQVNDSDSVQGNALRDTIAQKMWM